MRVSCPPDGRRLAQAAPPAAEDQDRTEEQERQGHEQPTDVGREHVDPAEQHEQATEDGLPAPATARRGTDARR